MIWAALLFYLGSFLLVCSAARWVGGFADPEFFHVFGSWLAQDSRMVLLEKLSFLSPVGYSGLVLMVVGQSSGGERGWGERERD